MAEKTTLRGALEESKRVAHDAAIRAKEAMEPGIKAARDAVGKLRNFVHLPRVDRNAGTVHSENCIYEVHESKRASGSDGNYAIHRREGDIDCIRIGDFDVSGGTLTIHCMQPGTLSEIAVVAAAWLEEPPPPAH